MDQPRKPIVTFRGMATIFVAFSLLMIFTPLGIPFGRIAFAGCNRVQLSWRRSHYETVIQQIERDFPNPTDLTSRKISGTQVTFSREASGRLVVFFEGFDMGHAGSWYKLYSNPPMTAREATLWVSPGNVYAVDAHWWTVNRSD